MENSVKQVALDKKALYEMTKWHNLDEYDYNGIVKSLYESHHLLPSKLGTTDLAKAEIMKDGWARSVYFSRGGNKLFRNLFGMIDLYNQIISGEIKLYVTPTTRMGILQDIDNSRSDEKKRFFGQAIDFLDENATYLTVMQDDYKEFYDLRQLIVNTYIDEGVFKLVDYYQALSLAEAAIFGLQFAVKRDDVFIHEDYTQWDCAKASKIEKINKELGLSYYDKDGKFTVPRVWAMWHLANKDRQVENGKKLTFSLWAEKGVIDNGKYIPESDRSVKNRINEF